MNPEGQTSKLRLVDSPATIALARGFTVFLGLATTLLIARELGSTGRGETAAAMSAMFLVPIFLGLGLPVVARRLTAHGRRDPAIRSIRLMCIPLFPVATIIGGLIVLGPLASLSDSERWIAGVGIALAPVAILWMTDESSLVSQGRYRSVASIQLMMPGSFFVLCAVAFVAGSLSVAFVLAACVAANLLTLMLSSALTRVAFRGHREPVLGSLKEGMTYAGAQSAEASANKLDQIILLPLVGAVELGYYSIAATVALMPLALSFAITAKSYAGIAQSTGGQRHERQIAAVRAILYWSLLAAIANVLVVSQLIPFVFGAEFEGAVIPCMICSIGTVGVMTAQVASNSLTAAKEGWKSTTGQVVGLVVGIALIFVLAPSFGAVGAAVASAVGYSIAMVWMINRLELGLRDFTPNRTRARAAFRELFTA